LCGSPLLGPEGPLLVLGESDQEEVDADLFWGAPGDSDTRFSTAAAQDSKDWPSPLNREVSVLRWSFLGCQSSAMPWWKQGLNCSCGRPRTCQKIKADLLCEGALTCLVLLSGLENHADAFCIL